MGTHESNQVYIWILSGTLGFILTIMVIVATAMARNLGVKLNELLVSLNQLIIVTTQQTEQIKTLFNNNESTEKRLHDHAERIRDIELNCKRSCLKD
jgi:hypothetical protein